MNEMEIKGELFAIKGAVAMLLAGDSIEKGLKLELLHQKLINTFIAVLTPAQGLASHQAAQLESHITRKLDDLFSMAKQCQEHLLPKQADDDSSSS